MKLLILALSISPAFATTRYIAASAGTFSGGSACNGHTAITATTWNSTSESAGDISYICGTITGSAGGTLLQVGWSGSSGNPIQLIFDTGAVLTAPYWLNGNNGGGSGAIAINGFSYITINGGPTCGWSQSTLTTTACNGSIVNTQNGTSLTYQQYTTAIDINNVDHIVIENLGCYNMYQRTGSAAEDTAWNEQHCVQLEGTQTNITITNCVMHDGGWLISSTSGTADNIFIGPGNDFYNADHDVQTAPTHFYVFGNHFHDWAIWDATGGPYHHDGVHCYAGTGGATQLFVGYNNQFDGNFGAVFQQAIYLEGNTSSTRCMLPGGTAYIFNNICLANGASQACLAFYGNATAPGDENDIMANNTIINNEGSTGTSAGQSSQNVSTGFVSENNATSGWGELFQSLTGMGNSTVDYNAYQNCSTFNCFAAFGADSGSFSTWQASGTCSGSAGSCDQHGIANLSSSTYFNHNSACVPGGLAVSCRQLTGSPLIAAGVNLHSTCNGQPVPGLGALCSDIAGTARPSSGAWDIGAYQGTGSPSVTGTYIIIGKLTIGGPTVIH
jgi:hypothetical protein